MKDKELLMKAIDSYDIYVATQRLTLKALIDLSIDGVASISPTSLSKLIKIGRGVIYNNLRILQEDGFIKNIGKDKNRIGLYKLNEVKLEEVIELYKKKLKYL
jgi:ribosomal protein S25